MKISIITATYNSETTIRDTIESVLGQTYSNIEYIVIDGKSYDGTMDIVKEYEGRLRYVSEKDKGIYDALNKGVKLATGDVVGFIHADDLLAQDNVIELVAKEFVDKNCDLLYGDLYYVDPSNIQIVRNWKSQPYKSKFIKRGWMPAHPTLYVRHSVYDKVGGFDTLFRISADYDFILRSFQATEQNKIAYLPQVMVRMRVGGVSNNGMENIICKMQEDLRALKNNKIKYGVLVLLYKNLSKIPQLIFRK